MALDLWEKKDRDAADQFRICLHGESKAISIYNAAGGGSGSQTTIFENTGKVFDGDWHKLALSARESQLTVCILPAGRHSPDQSLQGKEGRWRWCPGKVSPGQCYSLGDHQGLTAYTELNLTSAAKSYPMHNFGYVL